MAAPISLSKEKVGLKMNEHVSCYVANMCVDLTTLPLKPKSARTNPKTFVVSLPGLDVRTGNRASNFDQKKRMHYKDYKYPW